MSVPKSTESQVLGACLQLLTLRGVFAWRANQAAIPLKGGGFRRFAGLKGVSDILGVLRGGRLLAVECKRPGEKVRPEQAAFLARVNELGGVGVVVDDVKALEKLLEDLEE